MQKSVTGLTLAMAMALTFVVTIPDNVLGGVTKAPPSNDPEINGRTPESAKVLNISLHDVVLYAKVLGLQTTVEEMKRYDLNRDSFISKAELDQFPLLLNFDLFRDIEDVMKITLRDASTALTKSGLNITVGKLNEYDLDQDGFLSVVEIIKVPIGSTPRRSITSCSFKDRRWILRDLVSFYNRIAIYDQVRGRCTERDLIPLDLDEDGIISGEELEKMKRIPRLITDPFGKLILDNVKVSLEDAVKFLKEREYEVTVADLEEFDLDYDGCLPFTEIDKIPHAWRPNGPPSDVVDNFKISLEDSVVLFKGLFLHGEYPPVVSQVPFDLNNDGFLSYEELKAIPKRPEFLSCGLFEIDENDV